MKAYFDTMQGEFDRQLSTAVKARERMLDAVPVVEISPAHDVAARVEGLVGPKNVAQAIRELSSRYNRDKTCFEIARKILDGEFAVGENVDREMLADQAIRTGLALFTEGVVSAPIEGVSKVKIKQNPDGTDYLSVYFAGPIRGAGGTGQAFVLLLGDFCRKHYGLKEYRPLDSEIDRYKEEINLYARRTRAGQYVPTDDETAHVVKNCSVRIDGEPTEDYEVSVNRNVPSVETNRVRSGVCLVIGEGVCLKAAKVLKIAKKNGLEWQWVESLIKVSKQEAKKVEIKPVDRYMEEIVAGRPVFSFPMRRGGFRLRYGRTRFMGILAKGIHPATMVILDEFPVFGTQVKTERPAKGCVVTPCETIDGPIVLLQDDSVVRVKSVEQAWAVKPKVKEILFVGDMLACYGDFSKNNHPLVPSPWCEEWFALELKEKGIEKTLDELKSISFDQAAELAKTNSLPLAPEHTVFWSDLTNDEFQTLIDYLKAGKLEMEWFDVRKLILPQTPQKRVLELLGLEHTASQGNVIIERSQALSLLVPLAMLNEKNIDASKIEKAIAENAGKPVLEIINAVSPFEIRSKTGVYVGTAMGRPEKGRERKMKPPVHTLFPIGFLGGKTRNLMKAFVETKNSNPNVQVEVGIRACNQCGKKTWSFECECGGKTIKAFKCVQCGKLNAVQKCDCGGKGSESEIQSVNLVQLVEKAIKRVGFEPDSMKAVQGLISEHKTPELLEKGFLRAKHGINVFRDGTGRYDGTEIPCTHFTPKEIGITVSKAKELGYATDAFGKPLENDEQTVELKPQDVVISNYGCEYFLKVAKFVDDLLVYVYNLPAYYNASKSQDLVGRQCIAIAPHTSAGILCRIIGANEVQGILAHPYLHCACRRNADGDELALILLMDGLLNFSKEFLPGTRGGKMDAPLVLTTILDPNEVDDEVHAMDRSWGYPLEFYRATLNYANPADVKIDVIGDKLGTALQYEEIGYTHHATLDGSIPTRTKYVEMKTMAEKVEVELQLMVSIRAVDAQAAAEKIISSHFFPDLYGNLRSFSKQKFRCGECNFKYRRPPLAGKCRKCGGKLMLTIHKGGIEKYLGTAKDMAEKYDLPSYLRQRIMLIEKELIDMFAEQKEKQFSLSKFV